MKHVVALAFFPMYVLVGYPSTYASAQDFASDWRGRVTTELSIGVLNGKAQEFVFNPDGSELSRLDWHFDQVAMLNAATTIQLLDRLRLGVRGSLNLSDNSHMENRDFDVPFCPPASGGGSLCLSVHPDTKLREAAMVDASLAYDLYKDTQFTVSGVAGYKQDFFRWTGIGGASNYAPLPPGIGITYEQEWSAPYLGAALSARFDQLTLHGRIIGSNWADGSGLDDHHLRSTTFSDDFEKSRFIAADVGLHYHVNANTALKVDYSYQRWGTAEGATTITDRLFGVSGPAAPSYAGGNAESHMLAVGVSVALGPSAAAPPGLKDDVPVTQPSQRWNGLYAGALSGRDWNDFDWQTLSVAGFPAVPSTAAARFEGDGARGGVFVGWQIQSGTFVYGVEADFGRSNANEWQHGIPGSAGAPLLAAATDVSIVRQEDNASARLRLGVLTTRDLLVYATAGLAAGEVQASISCTGVFPSFCFVPEYEETTQWLTGYTVGAGYDWALGESWFTRGEYRYTDLGTLSHTFFADAPFNSIVADIDAKSHQLSFGIGYRF